MARCLNQRDIEAGIEPRVLFVDDRVPCPSGWIYSPPPVVSTGSAVFGSLAALVLLVLLLLLVAGSKK